MSDEQWEGWEDVDRKIVKNIFIILKDEYLKVFSTPEGRKRVNPSKTAIITRKSDLGVPLAYLMLMPAILDDGIVMSKSIYVEDDRRDTRGKLQLYYPDGVTYEGDAAEITRFRSAFMAALCAYLHNPDISGDNTKLGLIGTGEMNKAAFAILKSLFGIDQVVLRGSKRDPSKNKEFFSRMGARRVHVDRTPSGNLLNECELVISCTNSVDVEEALPLECLTHPRTIILQDGAFGIRVRRPPRTMFTDHPEQTLAHWDEEFMECDPPAFMLGLKSLCSACFHQAVVTLYGIAFADAILAREFAKLN